MPTDTTPAGQGTLNKPVVKPFPEPSPDEGKEEAVRSLVSPDMEEPAETNRPPLGN
jgi:hypothetical protein